MHQLRPPPPQQNSRRRQRPPPDAPGSPTANHALHPLRTRARPNHPTPQTKSTQSKGLAPCADYSAPDPASTWLTAGELALLLPRVGAVCELLECADRAAGSRCPATHSAHSAPSRTVAPLAARPRSSSPNRFGERQPRSGSDWGGSTPPNATGIHPKPVRGATAPVRRRLGRIHPPNATGIHPKPVRGATAPVRQRLGRIHPPNATGIHPKPVWGRPTFPRTLRGASAHRVPRRLGSPTTRFGGVALPSAAVQHRRTAPPLALLRTT